MAAGDSVRALSAHERRDDHAPGVADDLLAWLLAMDDSQVIDLIAPLIAGCVDAGSEDWSAGAGTSLAAQAARFNAATYWTADSDTYFGRVSKDQIAAAVQDVGGSISPAKKAEMAAEATRKVAGLDWLPVLLRMPPDDTAAVPSWHLLPSNRQGGASSPLLIPESLKACSRGLSRCF